MRRPLAIVAVVFCAHAAPASASLIERPYVAAPHSGQCLRATGAPGELATLGTGGLDLWSTQPSRTGHVAIPRQASCPELATSPNGTTILGVLAHRSATDPRTRLLVAVRPPGGTFGPFAEVARPGDLQASFAVAVNDRGDAVIAWRGSTQGAQVPALRVARSSAGGAFGAPEEVQPDGRGNSPGEPSVAAGIDAAGVVTVAWRRTWTDRLRVATAVPGARFSSPAVLGHRSFTTPALAVAPDGRALLAGLDAGSVEVFERAPGAAAFTRVAIPASDAQGYGGAPAVALAPSGAALVAWGDVAPGTVAAAWRSSGGAFGAPRPLARTAYSSERASFVQEAEMAFTGVAPDTRSGPQVALTDDGRAIVTWIGAAGPLTAARAHAATGDVASGLRPEPLGGRVHDAVAAVAVLEAGAPSTAWVDAQGTSELSDGSRERLHVAARGGAPAPSAPPPVSALRVASPIARFAGQQLPVAVRCAAACDVRASALGSAVSAHRPAGGTLHLAVPAPYRGFGTARGRRVVVRVLVSAPGGHAVRVHRARVRVVRRPPLPLPRIAGARARREGDHIVVTWRVRGSARRATFFAALTQRRSPEPASALGYEELRGTTRRRYRMVVRPLVPSPRLLARAHWAQIFVGSLDSDREARPVSVRVR